MPQPFRRNKLLSEKKNKKRKYTESRLVELQIAGENENLKSNYNEICIQQNNSELSQLKRQNINRQIISRTFFETGKFHIEKNICLGQIRTKDF